MPSNAREFTVRAPSGLHVFLVCLVLAVAGTSLVVADAVAQGLTDALSHPPPTIGPHLYSLPGTWLPGQLGFPQPGETYVDPVFGVTVRRLTNDFPGQSYSDIYGTNGWWNADGTRWYHRRVNGDNGDNGWVILDTTTGAIVRSDVPSSDDGFVQFDPVDPDIYYYYRGAQLEQYAVSTGTSSIVKTFPERLESLGASVNYLDRMGRYFVVKYSGELHIWDKQTDTIFTGSVPAAVGAGYAGISPDGNYLIVNVTSYRIDRDAQTLSTDGTLFWTLCNGTPHLAIMSASDGRTYVIVPNCYDEPSVWRVDVSLPQAAPPDDVEQQKSQNVRLFGVDWQDGLHFACAARGVNQDACFVSVESDDDTFADEGAWRPYKQEIVMAQMVPPYAVRRLVHHRSRNTDLNYYYEPRISANWDGTKIAWASNYGFDAGADIGYGDIYALELAVNGLPSIGSLAPNTVAAGVSGLVLTVNGSAFVSSSVVQWNGVDRITAFLSSTQLQASLPASDVATPGVALVTVVNPAPGGGTSTPLPLTIAPAFSLAVVRAGSGAGAVTSTPPGISCGTTCGANFIGGTAVVLTATPDASSAFMGWSGGGCTGTDICTVTVSAKTTVIATFTPTFVLTVSTAGAGAGTVTSSPASIDCGPACTASFTSGTSVTLTANPLPGSVFIGWSGGVCSGTDPCVVTVATGVTATFALQTFTLTVAWSGSGSGAVSSSPAGINCDAPCSALYTSGTLVTLTAAPIASSIFAGWSGGCGGTGPCLVAMSAATTVTATFTDPLFSSPDPTPAMSVIRAVDIIELRSAINQLRTQKFALPAFAFADPAIAPGVITVRIDHIYELRTALDGAYVRAGQAPPSYTDPLTRGVTSIRASHLHELRNAVRALQ